jgi:hypothetical protein
MVKGHMRLQNLDKAICEVVECLQRMIHTTKEIDLELS